MTEEKARRDHGFGDDRLVDLQNAPSDAVEKETATVRIAVVDTNGPREEDRGVCRG